jgi:hypothetical protein
MNTVLARICLLRYKWPLWKAVENMVATRNAHGAAQVSTDTDVHVVLVPRKHMEKFALLVNEFHESIRE